MLGWIAVVLAGAAVGCLGRDHSWPMWVTFLGGGMAGLVMHLLFPARRP